MGMEIGHSRGRPGLLGCPGTRKPPGLLTAQQLLVLGRCQGALPGAPHPQAGCRAWPGPPTRLLASHQSLPPRRALKLSQLTPNHAGLDCTRPFSRGFFNKYSVGL